jgi:hypothetical protein
MPWLMLELGTSQTQIKYMNTWLMFSVLKSTIFWDMTPCSPYSCTRRFGGTYRLHLQGRRIVQQTSEQAGSSEMSSTTQWTTRRHIPEDGTLQNTEH